MKRRLDMHIPRPCHEDWGKMTIVDEGRFCNSCSKIVVDFTNMSNDEILQYFSKNAGQGICGRFTSAQVNMPSPATKRTSLFHTIVTTPFKKVAAMLITGLTLLTSACQRTTMGEAKGDMYRNKPAVIDSSAKTGEVSLQKKTPVSERDKACDPIILIGDTVAMPEETRK